ncbi:hypothetical protein HWV62_18514 [Athelia sp. TMB]|nr:hypothetical protein HWV62_18514 [Athelia sp. TMB]
MTIKHQCNCRALMFPQYLSRRHTKNTRRKCRSELEALGKTSILPAPLVRTSFIVIGACHDIQHLDSEHSHISTAFESQLSANHQLRKRGRPRSKPACDSSAVKRKPGRPKAPINPNAPILVKRKPGRPRKVIPYREVDPESQVLPALHIPSHPKPKLLVDKTQTRGQLNLFDFSLPGNTRANSSTAARTPTTNPDAAPSNQAASIDRVHYIIQPEDPDRQIEDWDKDEDFEFGGRLGEGEGEEHDGGEDEPGDDVNNRPHHNRHSILPPAVHETYTQHIELLKQHQDVSGVPRIYSHYGTFWLPQKSNYFLLHGKSKPRPTQMYWRRTPYESRPVTSHGLLLNAH